MGVLSWWFGPTILKGGQKAAGDPIIPFQGHFDNGRYESYSRSKSVRPADSFVMHDTAGGGTWGQMLAGSNARCAAGTSCYGITFSGDPSGQLRQHHDLRRRSEHGGASWINDRAHGKEDISPFYGAPFMQEGKLFTPRKPWPGQRIIEAPYLGRMGGGKIVLPSPPQLEASYQLLQYLADLPESEGGGLVLEWPGLREGRMLYSTIPGIKANFTPGVYAHGHLSDNRADGYSQALYTYLRHHGHSKGAAIDHVIRMSEGARKSGGQWSSPLPPNPSAASGMMIKGAAAVGLGVLGYFGLRRFW